MKFHPKDIRTFPPDEFGDILFYASQVAHGCLPDEMFTMAGEVYSLTNILENRSAAKMAAADEAKNQ